MYQLSADRDKRTTVNITFPQIRNPIPYKTQVSWVSVGSGQRASWVLLSRKRSIPGCHHWSTITPLASLWNSPVPQITKSNAASGAGMCALISGHWPVARYRRRAEDSTLVFRPADRMTSLQSRNALPGERKLTNCQLSTCLQFDL